VSLLPEAERHVLEAALLANAHAQHEALRALLDASSDHWSFEDPCLPLLSSELRSIRASAADRHHCSTAQQPSPRPSAASMVPSDRSPPRCESSSCRADVTHSHGVRECLNPRSTTIWPVAEKADASRSARSNNLAARYHRGAMRKRSRCSRAGRATLARRIVVGLHGCRRSISRIGALLSQQQVRRTTVGAILKAGGSLRPSAGPPHHHDLHGLTPQQFDAILGLPEPNPVQKPDRWKPS